MFNRYQNLFLALLLFPICLTAQQPFPIPADSPHWNTVEDYFFNPGTFQTFWTMPVDTLMCGQNYGIAEPDQVNPFITGYKKAYVRNQGQQVWYRTDTSCSSPERLMYDFGLQVGDTFALDVSVSQDPFTIDTTRYRIDSITTVTFNGVSRRKFELFPLNSGQPRTWLEGIGDLDHPFYSLLFDGTEEDLRTLCYDSLGTQLYQDPQFGTCSIFVSVEQPIPGSVTVHPNPSREGWYMDVELGMVDIVVYDLSGRRVFQQEAKGTNRFYIPAQNTPGVYLLEIEEGGRKRYQKLIQR